MKDNKSKHSKDLGGMLMVFAKHHAIRNSLLWRCKYGIRRFFKKTGGSVRGLNKKPREKLIIVSLTSIPSRIHAVPFVVDALLNQTLPPDKIILYLNQEEFLAEKLPKNLILQQQLGLEIVYCDNLKSHKKYFYVMQTYPEDIVITVDDDLKYSVDLVEKLYTSYLAHNHAVSAMRAHIITFDDNNKLNPFDKWPVIDDEIMVGKESMSLLATTGAGTLFPPYCLHRETFNKQNIKRTCLEADDLWLKAMSVLQGTPVVLAAPRCKLLTLKGTQDKTLYMTNRLGNNDKQMQQILAIYNDYNDSQATLLDTMRKS